MPKADARSIPNLEGNKIGEIPQPFIPKAHPHRAHELPLNSNPFSKPHTSQQSPLHKQILLLLHNHFPNRTLLNNMGFLTPNPPLEFGEHIVFLFTR
jgi:hypothetical protein